MFDLKISDFNTYPHLVYATAFLVDGMLADYKIGDHTSCWSLRTFRGRNWENKVFERLRTNDIGICCAYKSIEVNNKKEHNKAFDELEDWLFETFKVYPEVNLQKWG